MRNRPPGNYRRQLVVIVGFGILSIALAVTPTAASNRPRQCVFGRPGQEHLRVIGRPASENSSAVFENIDLESPASLRSSAVGTLSNDRSLPRLRNPPPGHRGHRRFATKQPLPDRIG